MRILSRTVGLGACVGAATLWTATADAHNAVARYVATSGALDTSFNQTGKVLSGQLFDKLSSAVVTGGKTIVGGAFLNPDGRYRVLVGKYNANGTPDTTFGWLGATTAYLYGTHEEAVNVAIDSSGRIVALVRASTPTGTTSFLTRFNSNGTLDTTFGGSGFVGVYAGDPTGLKIANDGKIVFLRMVDWSHGTFAVNRLTSIGADDFVVSPTFGSGGLERAFDVAVDSERRILVAGGSGSEIGVLRLTSTGALDNTFGTAGRLMANFGYSNEYATGVAVDDINRVYLVGRVYDFTNAATKMFLLKTDVGGGTPYTSVYTYPGSQTPTGNVRSSEWNLAMAGNGSVYVTGDVKLGGVTQFEVAKFSTSNWALNWASVTPFSGYQAAGYCVAVDPSNYNAVVTGMALTPP